MYYVKIDYYVNWLLTTPYPKSDADKISWEAIKNYIKVEQNKKFPYPLVFKYYQDPKTKKFGGWFTKDEGVKVVRDLKIWCDSNNIHLEFSPSAIKRLDEILAYEDRAKFALTDLPTQPIAGVTTELRPFQYTAVEFLKKAGGRGLIGLEPGMGKTLIAIAYCEAENKKAIVICPSQAGKTKRSWEHQIKEHTKSSSTVMYSSTPIDLAKLISSKYIIFNYDIVDKFSPLIELLVTKAGYTVMILDESHKIKNSKTDRFLAVEPLINKVPHRIELSATSIENKRQDLYSQLHFVAPEKFPSREIFKDKYCGKWNWRLKRPVKQTKAQLNQLREDISGIYFFRDKRKYLLELPPLDKETVWIDDEKAKLIADTVKHKQQQYFALAKAMMPYTIEFVFNTAMEQTTQKIILYSGLTKIVDELTIKLNELQEGCAVSHHGKAGKQEQAESFTSFIKDPKVKVIVATYQSFSESINVQHISNYVVYNDIPYTASKLEQGWGRIHRMGQQFPCYCRFMGFKDTYHEDVKELVEGKAQDNKKILANRETNLSYLDEVEESVKEGDSDV